MRTAALLATLLTLTACEVGPNYKPPQPPAGTTAPFISATPTLGTTAQPLNNWWQLYNDPLLDKYLQEAFAANYDLAAAQANLGASRAILDATRSQLYPNTRLATGALYGRDAATDEILEIDGHKPFNVWLFDDILDASYELDLFGGIRRSIEAARDNAQAVADERDDLKITVAAETARAYAQICTLGEQIAVAQRSLDLARHEAAISANEYNAGDNSRFDLLRVQGIVPQVRASIPVLEGQRRGALFSLAVLLGRPPSAAPFEAQSCVTAPRQTSLIPLGDGASLIRRRPDVRRAERQLAADTARIGVATATLYPQITLTGLYGGAATTPGGLTTESGLTWGVGPAISWDFPNQSLPRARIREAKASTAAALATFDATILQALSDTETALATYSSELDHRQALAEAQSNADETFRMANDQLAAGSISTLDLLTTEQTMINADAAVAASDAALVQDQIAVFKALGGGWQNSGPAEP